MSSKPASIQQSIEEFFAGHDPHYYNKGTVLFRPEDIIDKVLYIVRGSIVQYDIAPNGNEIIVNVFKTGAFIPMSFALNRTPNLYYFEATSDLIVQQATAETVIQFLKDNPAVMLDLLARVYRGTDGLQRRMAHLMGGDATSRLLFELINAAKRFGTVDQNGATTIPLTATDIAKRSGLSRETVSRTITKLKRHYKISIKAHTIIVDDLAKLESGLGSEL